MTHLDKVEDLTQLDDDAITQGLREIMVAKLKAVEAEVAHGGAPTPDPESTDIETKDAADFDAFADWALGGLGGKGNGGGKVH